MDLTATIAIKVAAEMTNVGLVTWEAGFFLAEVILAHKELFANKRCVELGAGVGLTGIVLSEVALPKSLVLTDCSSTVLRNIVDNARQSSY
jgi:predicted nicotinamide N-methyase